MLSCLMTYGCCLRQAETFTIPASMDLILCRMARAALNWSAQTLAVHAGVSVRTVLRFEAGDTVALETVEALRSALVEGGVLFVEMSGKVGVLVKPHAA